MPSSGYTAITFVANEQPTTAKWNLIGSNDSSFNLGTGLEDNVILNRHLASTAVSPGKIDNASFPLIVQAKGTTSFSMTIPGNGVVIFSGAARIGTAVGTVGANATGTAVITANIYGGIANDADYVHIPVGGSILVKAGSLTVTITGGIDNLGIAGIFIPVITSTTF